MCINVECNTRNNQQEPHTCAGYRCLQASKRKRMSHAPAPEGAAGAARPLLTSWHVQEARRDARSAPRRQTPGTIPGTKPNSGYGTLGYDSQSGVSILKYIPVRCATIRCQSTRESRRPLFQWVLTRETRILGHVISAACSFQVCCFLLGRRWRMGSYGVSTMPTGFARASSFLPTLSSWSSA